MATQSPRRGAARPRSGALRGAGRAAGDAAGFEDVVARAARLGVTPQKVLREYARIAFADLRHIVEWDKEGLRVKARLSEADAASISEISAGTSGKGPVRVKLYDKKAALDAIARYLGMFVPHERRHGDDAADPAEDAREVLKRELARLAARGDPEQAG